MAFSAQVGARFTRADVQNILQVPLDRRGGDWTTGYTQFSDEFFVFCNVGVAGRTGHDYDNHWNGEILVWSAKRGATRRQPQISRMTSGTYPIHIFYRSQDRSAFIYAGQGRAAQIDDVTPVRVHWTFAPPPRELPDQTKLLETLKSRGFSLDEPGVHTQRATRGRTVLYVKRLTNSFPLVVAPEWEENYTKLLNIGALRPKGRFYYHNSTMRSFPRRLHGGAAEIPYGIDFGFDSSGILNSFLDVLTGAFVPPATPADEFQLVDPKTETEVTRAARLGQQRFRQALLDRYKGCCALTGINMPEVLRASHIKPWKLSADHERLDPDNGLLLAVQVDVLFDQGLISFDDEGWLLAAARLSDEILRSFGLTRSMRLNGILSAGNKAYLQLHRAAWERCERR